MYRPLLNSMALAIVTFIATAPQAAYGQAIIKHLSTSSLAGKELTRDSFSLSELNDAKTLAKSGDVEAQYRVAILNHMRGAYSQAEAWYRRAALFRHPLAAYNLGLMYYQGEGVEMNHEEAARWFEVSANADYPDAAFQLGLMHYRGDGVPKNPALEAQWYRRSALGGNAEAQFNMAVLHSKGEGVAEDPVAALAWLDMAVANGVDAQAQLSDMRSTMSPAQRQAAASLRAETESLVKRPIYIVTN
ncbi:MAG: hypothetical protein DHS20C11_00890 [Lysobacteraceae bacterium]|nr:MAG: hypothetical protein DHS20C11_00890 [Xanthomonadaceae bacterium]